MRSRVLASMVWMGVMAAGGSASAQDRRVDAPWRVSFDVGGRWHHDSGLDAPWETRSPPVTGLSFGRDLVGIGDRATLAVDLNWNAENFEGRLRDSLTSRLTAHSMSAGLSLRVRTLWWLEPYARVAAGALYSDILLTPESDSSQGGAHRGRVDLMGNAGPWGAGDHAGVSRDAARGLRAGGRVSARVVARDAGAPSGVVG